MGNPLKQLKVLVLEDNPGDVFLIKFYLEELDPDLYDIESVETLEDAHNKMQITDYDIVLLNLHVPDSQGMDTLISSVQKFPNFTFIVMTGLSDGNLGLDAVKNGAQDFLVKGRFDGKILDSAIKFAIQRSQMKHKIEKYLEILNTIGEMNNMATFIVQPNTGIFEHTNNFASYIGRIEDIDTLEEFAELTSNGNEVKENIERTIKEEDLTAINIDIENQSYLLKLKKAINGVIGTIEKVTQPHEVS